jgi:hypothetical protein
MHAYNTESYHGPFDVSVWLQRNHVYEVHYQRKYEGYYIARKPLVPFDERFRGRRRNKQSHVFEMWAAGWRFWIMPNSWIVDTPHEHSVRSDTYVLASAWRSCALSRLPAVRCAFPMLPCPASRRLALASTDLSCYSLSPHLVVVGSCCVACSAEVMYNRKWAAFISEMQSKYHLKCSQSEEDCWWLAESLEQYSTAVAFTENMRLWVRQLFCYSE